MAISARNIQLKVEKIGSNCRIELVWCKQTEATIITDYPEKIIVECYRRWQTCYLTHYHLGQVADDDFLPPNSQKSLENSQTKFLKEFKNWLNHALLDIRTKLADIVKKLNEKNKKEPEPIYIFISCNSDELDRLPWEQWDIQSEFLSSAEICLIRSTIKASTNSRLNKSKIQKPQGNRRILVIIGDTSNIDVSKDLETLKKLEKKSNFLGFSAQVEQIKQETSVDKFKEAIYQKVADSKGWDMLFFLGHSEENAIMIAPKVHITVEEIEPYIKIAIKKGLQFACFNSCNGLSIAKKLLDFSLNQIVIMREKIEDKVAHYFLENLVTALKAGDDLCSSVKHACQSLKKYPSADLIPSLFSHPEAEIYSWKHDSWHHKFKQWQLNPYETIVATSVGLISLLTPVQEILLNWRTITQAVYRDLTAQVNQEDGLPPVFLVSIDAESLNLAQIDLYKRNPLDRKYLAQIIEQVIALDAQIIGVDYLLDQSQANNDQLLSKVVEEAIAHRQARFVFATFSNGYQETPIISEIGSLDTVVIGNTDGGHLHVNMPSDCREICPFAYLLAINQIIETENINLIKLNQYQDYRSELLESLKQTPDNEAKIKFLQRNKIHLLTIISEYFQQSWLQPIIDFSLPYQQIYQKVSASQLEELLVEGKLIANEQVVLIASGGYPEAGINGKKDHFDAPWGFTYWHLKNYQDTNIITGGEAIAYRIHHWLNQHLVIPIPDLWLVVLAIIMGKGIRIRSNLFTILCVGNLVYIAISLQAYVTLKILLPWLLPSIAFWLITIPKIPKKNRLKLI